MTKEQVEKLDLGIGPIDSRVILLVESAFHWINDNTDLNVNYDENQVLEKLSPNIKLFIIKYFDLMTMSAGVSSESIGGLSHSFDTTNKSDLLWQYATELLGNNLKSQMSFVSAKPRWF